MVLTSMEQKQALKQMPLAMFEYEIFEAGGRYLNLYDRTNSEQSESFLRFLVQVPVDTNCTTEGSVRQAVDEVYKKMGATELPIIRVQAKPLGDCNHLMPFFDYLR